MPSKPECVSVPLSIGLFCLEFVALDDIPLPDYTGFAWRGLFGHGLKQSVCRMPPHTRCEGCLLRNQCAYIQVFETPPPDDTARMRRYPVIPHPFILNPELKTSRQVGSGAHLFLNVHPVSYTHLTLPTILLV